MGNGIIIIATLGLLYFQGLSPNNYIVENLSLPIFILSLTTSVIVVREALLNKFIDFKTAFKVGLTTAVIYGIVFGLWRLILGEVIYPELLAEETAALKKAFMDKSNDSEMNFAFQLTIDALQQPLYKFFTNIASFFLVGSLFSLFNALLFSRSKKPVDQE